MKSNLITKKIIFVGAISLLIICCSAEAQVIDNGNPDISRSSTGRIRSPQEVETMQRLDQQRRTNSQFNELRAMTDRNSIGNSGIVKNFEADMKKAKKYIAPDSEYKTQNKSFLNSKYTGIIKLLPNKPCIADEKNPIKQCPQNFISGNGRCFSFRWKDYVIDKWADLENLDGFFVSNGTDNQGILVNLGDVSLEDLTLTTKGIEFLTNFTPSTQAEEVGKQYMQFWNEIETEGFRYAKVLAIETDKTYALRVVAYERDIELVLTEQQKRMTKDPELRKLLFDPLRRDKRQDLIVAFRVLEKSEDGSVTIMWKELQRKTSPYIGNK